VRPCRVRSRVTGRMNDRPRRRCTLDAAMETRSDVPQRRFGQRGRRRGRRSYCSGYAVAGIGLTGTRSSTRSTCRRIEALDAAPGARCFAQSERISDFFDIPAGRTNNRQSLELNKQVVDPRGPPRGEGDPTSIHARLRSALSRAVLATPSTRLGCPRKFWEPRVSCPAFPRRPPDRTDLDRLLSLSVCLWARRRRCGPPPCLDGDGDGSSVRRRLRPRDEHL
jgi:hypothetical protein